jgi:hypothetical protein
MRIVHYDPTMPAGESGPATAVRGWVSAIRSAGVPTAAVVDRDVMRLPPPSGAECIALGHRGHGWTRVLIRLLDVIEGDDLERSTSRGVDHIRRDTRFGERLDDRARREGTAHML